MEKNSKEIVSNTCESLGYTKETTARLIDAYSEPHRAYHNLDHIAGMLSLYDKNHDDKDYLFYGPYVKQAILWHDVIYPQVKAGPGLFEMHSILEYKKFIVRSIHTQVPDMIMATAFHDRDQSGYLPHVLQFLDLDLSSFAKDWDGCWEDSEKVAAELIPVYGEKAFLMGNVKFLETLLARKSIYYVHPEWEENARNNLQNIILERKKLMNAEDRYLVER